MPSDFQLYQNYPNPFNLRTEIVFDLPRSTAVTLVVYNLLGRPVATLARGDFSAGSHKAAFDGALLPSGVYWYRLEAGGYSFARKMILLK
jgi:hypothetical protein